MVKGDLKLDIDEQALAVRVTIAPRDDGEEVSAVKLVAALSRKNVHAAVDMEAVDKALRDLTRRRTEPVTFVAAAGTPPRPPEPEQVDFEDAAIPHRLQGLAQAVLERAPQPIGYRIREEKIRKEKKVLKKAALPFLPPQEDVEIVIEKKLVREDVPIDPKVLLTGFVARGAVVAKIRPARPGKEGKNVFGRMIPPPRMEQDGFLFCDGLSRAGNVVTAARSGFLRRGATWCDIVEFRDHAVKVAAGTDGSTCLLSFEPGNPLAPLPAVDDIIARAGKLGFPSTDLPGAVEINALLAESVRTGTPLKDRSLSPKVDGMAAIAVSPDGLTAMLTLRKSRGGGRALTLAGVADAVRESRVRRYAQEAVRRDIQEFFKGPGLELKDYQLAVGKAAETGRDGEVKWLAEFLPPDEVKKIRAIARAGAAQLSDIASMKELPLDAVEAVGRVSPEAAVLRITPGTVGASGVDVFGATMPGRRGATPELRLFEGLEQRQDLVVAVEEGLLEKGSSGKTILLRVRPHTDADVRATVSDDRMKGFLSFTPPRGTGRQVDAAEVRAAIAEAGIVRGVDEGRMARIMEAIAQRKAFTNIVIAEGKKPDTDTRDPVTFHVRLATGKTVTFREDGTADFRAQDRITSVLKGAHIATVKAPPTEAWDAWDVTGRPILPPRGSQGGLTPGRGISVARQPDGSLEVYAQVSGELIHDGSLVAVEQVHTVDGDVDMSSGNVTFTGIVRVRGSVNAGFKVIAAGDIEVEETVEGAMLTSQRSIIIGQGIKGFGKATLRAGKSILAPFAEQAMMRAADSVHLKGACLRCNIVCGKLSLDSEKGNLVGGETKARNGIVVQNLGSPSSTRTLVWFGQDYMIEDEIGTLQEEVTTIEKGLADLDARLKDTQKAAGTAPLADSAARARADAERDTLLRTLEQRKAKIAELTNAFGTHYPSEIFVRGTLYPGVVLECHGKHWETRTEKNMITLTWDAKQRQIVEKL